MSLTLLIKDEFKGFYKSAIMIVLWIGLPLTSLLIYFITPSMPDLGGFPLFSLLFATIMVSMGGTLASIMLAVYIVHEKTKNVYELFLIRPIRRSDILISKFIAVFLCILLAVILSLSLGLALDYYSSGQFTSLMFQTALESLIITAAAMSVSCAVGILVGMLSSSVLVAVLLIVFVANNIVTLVIYLPVFISMENPVLYTTLSCVITAVLLMLVSIADFKRKQF